MITDSQALVILTKIHSFHGPQDTGDATCRSWAEALNEARVTSVQNAVRAVIRHYATAGTNPWITPGDVAAGARRIGDDRLDRIEMPVPNANPDDPHAYAIEYRALRDAIRDGLTDNTLDSYRNGDISFTGRPALTGPMSDPNPEIGPAVVREVTRRATEARKTADAAERDARQAIRDEQAAECDRQVAALIDRYPDARIAVEESS